MIVAQMSAGNGLVLTSGPSGSATGSLDEAGGAVKSRSSNMVMAATATMHGSVDEQFEVSAGGEGHGAGGKQGAVLAPHVSLNRIGLGPEWVGAVFRRT